MIFEEISVTETRDLSGLYSLDYFVKIWMTWTKIFWCVNTEALFCEFSSILFYNPELCFCFTQDLVIKEKKSSYGIFVAKVQARNKLIIVTLSRKSRFYILECTSLETVPYSISAINRIRSIKFLAYNLIPIFIFEKHDGSITLSKHYLILGIYLCSTYSLSDSVFSY